MKKIAWKLERRACKGTTIIDKIITEVLMSGSSWWWSMTLKLNIMVTIYHCESLVVSRPLSGVYCLIFNCRSKWGQFKHWLLLINVKIILLWSSPCLFSLPLTRRLVSLLPSHQLSTRRPSRSLPQLMPLLLVVLVELLLELLELSPQHQL